MAPQRKFRNAMLVKSLTKKSMTKIKKPAGTGGKRVISIKRPKKLPIPEQPMAPGYRRAPNHFDDRFDDRNHASNVHDLLNALTLMSTICNFVGEGITSLNNDHHPEASIRSRRPNLHGIAALIPSFPDYLKEFEKISKRGPMIKNSNLKNLPPGLKRSHARLVPYDSNRHPSYSTCEVPEIADPEKGARCFAMYNSKIPGGLHNEVSEYYVKNGLRLAADQVNGESTDRLDRFKKLDSFLKTKSEETVVSK